MKGRLKRIGRLSLYQKNITFRKASPKGSSLERFPTLSIYIYIYHLKSNVFSENDRT